MTDDSRPLTTENQSHTPGPWSNDRIWDTPESRIHARVEGIPVALAEVFSMRNGGEKEANARLIAAAPELLTLAHQYAAECAECAGSGKVEMLSASGHPAGEIDCEDCADIRAVIAKAEGKL